MNKILKMLLFCFPVLIIACGSVDEASEKVEETANNAKDKVKDGAVCNGILRGSLFDRVDDTIAEISERPLSIEDLTEIGAAFALTLDATSLTAGNLLAISNAVSNVDCDASQVCEDPVLGESNGTLSKTCEGSATTFNFEDECQLYVTPIDGALTIDGSVWSFEDFQIIDERFINGGVIVENATAQEFAVQSVSEDGFSWVRNAGTSCEDALEFRSLSVDRRNGLEVSTDFDRATESGTDYTVTAADVLWPDDRSCICPTGGAASIAFSALREREVPFTFDVLFSEDGGCGSASVDIPEVSEFCDAQGCDSAMLTDGLDTILGAFCR